MIGKRTQAYFVGFLIGIAIVSILIDSRRNRMQTNQKPATTWVAIHPKESEYPPMLIQKRGTSGYVSCTQEKDDSGTPTGKIGYFFSNPQGQKYWIFKDNDNTQLYSAEYLDATSQPNLEFDLMKSGFKHQGHEVISDENEIPNYRIKINVSSASEFIEAYENLKSKHLYIAEVKWVTLKN